MKTWRWMLVMLSAGSLAAACTVETKKTDDDSGPSSSSSVVSSSSSSVASSTSSTTMTCADEPTFGECADCYCNENANECNAYITALINNVYCGQTCGADECATFCADPNNNDLDQACSDCSNTVADDPNVDGDPGEVDIDNFVADCSADSSCVSFAQTIQGCPDT